MLSGVTQQGLINAAPGVGQMGWGASSVEALEELQKALVAGTGIDPAQFTSGRAMTLESLDSTLVQRLFDEKEARLFRKLKPRPVGSVVHQWAERTGVGTVEGAFTSEGGNSVKQDQTLGRKFTEIKYLQFHREATLQAVLTGDRGMSLEGALALETNAGALQAVQSVEHFLFSGNSANYPLQFDGLEAQLFSERAGIISQGFVDNILDVRAKPSTETLIDRMEEATDLIRRNFGYADCMIGDVQTMTGIQRYIRPRMRFPVDQMQGQVAYGGGNFNIYPTFNGDLELMGDVFVSADGITRGPGTVPKPSTLTGAPVADSLTAATVSVLNARPMGEPDGVWSADDEGDYFYTVVASNNMGDGPSDAGSAAATIPSNPTTGTYVQIACTVATGANRPTAIKLYRSKKDGTADTEHRYVKTVPVPAGTTTTINIFDGNHDLPGTSKAYILTSDPSQKAIDWIQFLPLMRFNLFPGSAAVWPFLVLLYGSLALYKPERHVMLRNIVPENSDWFD